MEPNLIGMCEFFDVKPFINAANILVAADEPLRALALLDNLPGYYRDHLPQEIDELKHNIHSLLATPHFYANNKWDEEIKIEGADKIVDGLLRGQQILKDVQYYNINGTTPHIFDLGPGEYWLPIGLKQKGCHFTYEDIGLNQNAKKKVKDVLFEHWDESNRYAPCIFVACELIEHLHNEADIAVEMRRARLDPEIIHISTPLYTFDGRKERLQWQMKGDLGHLRTYTPSELYNVITKMFRDYKWELLVSNIMHMRGVRIERT